MTHVKFLSSLVLSFMFLTSCSLIQKKDYRSINEKFEKTFSKSKSSIPREPMVRF